MCYCAANKKKRLFVLLLYFEKEDGRQNYQNSRHNHASRWDLSLSKVANEPERAGSNQKPEGRHRLYVGDPVVFVASAGRSPLVEAVK